MKSASSPPRAIPVLFRLLLLSLGFCPPLFAGWDFSLQSVYEGDGSFRYEASVDTGPFIYEVYTLDLAIPATNDWSRGPIPGGWAVSTSISNELGYGWEKVPPITRQESAVFTIESTEPEARLATAYYLFGFSYCTSSNRILAPAGYLTLETLIPARAGQGSSAPTNRMDSFKALSDPDILDITADSITLGFPYSKDLVIEASTNLVQWNPVHYAYDVLAPYEWKPGPPLTDYGSYFRAQYTAYCTQNPPPDLAALAGSEEFSPPSSPAPIRSMSIRGSNLVLTVETEPDQIYHAGIRTPRDEFIILHDFLADSRISQVQLPLISNPGQAVLVEVWALE